MNQAERRRYMIRELLKEIPQYGDVAIPKDTEEQKQLLRGLMNIRRPGDINSEFIRVQDVYLQAEISEKGIIESEDLSTNPDGLVMWQGDITTLRCDAIVNAANSGMTGCYISNHRCVDNCIHSFSGIQLRRDCSEIIEKQGFEETTGRAKITKAYNLPCKYILHTVGPIIAGELTDNDCELLASCYRSCLKLAANNNLSSVAFCCISTGEFHFPNDKAAEIAVCTVREFMKKKTSVRKVIFNVFKDMDKKIYEKLL
jgi:O-acetyl-ADP-ribose deacetylase (regulator of RNase III)